MHFCVTGTNNFVNCRAEVRYASYSKYLSSASYFSKLTSAEPFVIQKLRNGIALPFVQENPSPLICVILYFRT